ncbi:MAG TPA: hypothetical protein VFH08_00560 [Chitinophagaceae bacterium]|nr:hypothetical protein [Chitinophagaceae bacterium]
MKTNQNIFKLVLARKLTTLLMIGLSFAAFATLGDGKSKGKKTSLLNSRPTITPGKFSLKSGYQYRGSQILNQQKDKNAFTRNSLVTYQKGNMTYILPVKTVIPRKIKITVGIPQLSRN